MDTNFYLFFKAFQRQILSLRGRRPQKCAQQRRLHSKSIQSVGELAVQFRQFGQSSHGLVRFVEQRRLGSNHVLWYRRGGRRQTAHRELQRVDAALFYFFLAASGLLCFEHVCGRCDREFSQVQSRAREGGEGETGGEAGQKVRGKEAK